MPRRKSRWFGAFGGRACQIELKMLDQEYTSYHFEEAPFNHDALHPNTYLIVGRRGTGKSTLLHYLTFQNRTLFSRCVLLENPEYYADVLLQRRDDLLGDVDSIAIPHLAMIWEHTIWTVIFSEYRDLSPKIAAACELEHGSAAEIARQTLQLIKTKFLMGKNGDPLGELQKYLRSSVFKTAKKKVLEITPDRPILVGIDCLEQYPRHKLPLLWAIAGLISATAKMNLDFVDQGIHIKTVIPEEIFSHLMSDVLLNPAKEVQGALFLMWTPGDLIRFSMYRYYKYVFSEGASPIMSPRTSRSLPRRHGSVLPHPLPKRINWENAFDVKREMWDRYASKSILNRNQQEEDSWAYILRHSQLRPRQLVIILNKVSTLSRKGGAKFHFTRDAIVNGIWDVESELVTELKNSYSRLFPAAGVVIQSLAGLPIAVSGQEIIKRLKDCDLPDGCNLEEAKRLLVHLGVVGKVDSNTTAGVKIFATFRYVSKDGFLIQKGQNYAIHPLFVRHLGARNEAKQMVYPVGGTEI